MLTALHWRSSRKPATGAPRLADETCGIMKYDEDGEEQRRGFDAVSGGDACSCSGVGSSVSALPHLRTATGAPRLASGSWDNALDKGAGRRRDTGEAHPRASPEVSGAEDVVWRRAARILLRL